MEENSAEGPVVKLFLLCCTVAEVGLQAPLFSWRDVKGRLNPWDFVTGAVPDGGGQVPFSRQQPQK